MSFALSSRGSSEDMSPKLSMSGCRVASSLSRFDPSFFRSGAIDLTSMMKYFSVGSVSKEEM